MTTDSTQMRLLFTQPPYAMGANGRLHWARKARLVKAKRAEARLVALAALRQFDCFSDFTPRVYDVYWYYARGVEPDEDNVLSRCKALLDGCADALRVNDRSWHLGQIHRVKVGTRDALAGRVELVFVNRNS